MLKNKYVIKLIAIFAVLLMSMYMLTGCEFEKSDSSKKKDKNDDNKEVTSSYEEPVKYMVEGLSEANSKKFLKAFPDFISEHMEDIFTDEYLENTLKTAESEFGENIEMSYKITDKTEIDEDELNKMEEDIKNSFDEEITITKGYELGVEVTTKGDDAEDTEEDEFNVYEVDGKWYILDL